MIKKVVALMSIIVILVGTIPPISAQNSGVPLGEEVYYGSWALFYLSLALWLTNPDNMGILLLLDQLDNLSRTCHILLQTARGLDLLTESEDRNIENILDNADTCCEIARQLLSSALEDNNISENEAEDIARYVATAASNYYTVLSLLIPKLSAAADELEEMRLNIKQGIEQLGDILQILYGKGENVENLFNELSEVFKLVERAEVEGMENREGRITIRDNLVLIKNYLSLAKNKLEEVRGAVFEIITKKYLTVAIENFVSLTSLVLYENRENEIKGVLLANGTIEISISLPRLSYLKDVVIDNIVGPEGVSIYVNGAPVTVVETRENPPGGLIYKIVASIYVNRSNTLKIKYDNTVARVTQRTGWTQVGDAVAGERVRFSKAVTLEKDARIRSFDNNWDFVLVVPVPTSYPETLKAETTRGPATVNTMYGTPEVTFKIAGASETVTMTADDGIVRFSITNASVEENALEATVLVANTGNLPHVRIVCRTGLRVPGTAKLILKQAPKGQVVVENDNLLIRIDHMDAGEACLYRIRIENIEDPFETLLGMVKALWYETENMIRQLPPEDQDSFLQELNLCWTDIVKAEEERSVDLLLSVYERLIILKDRVLDYMRSVGVKIIEGPWLSEDKIIANNYQLVNKTITIVNAVPIQKSAKLEVALPEAADNKRVFVYTITPLGRTNLDFSISGNKIIVENILVGGRSTLYVVVECPCLIAKVDKTGYRQEENIVNASLGTQPNYRGKYILTYTGGVLLENFVRVTVIDNIPSRTAYNYRTTEGSLTVTRSALVAEFIRKGSRTDNFDILYTEAPPFVYFLGIGAERVADDNENIFRITVYGKVTNNTDSDMENVLFAPFNIPACRDNTTEILGGTASIYSDSAGAPPLLILRRLPKFSESPYRARYLISEGTILFYYYSLQIRRAELDNSIDLIDIQLRDILKENLALIDNLLNLVGGLIGRWENIENILNILLLIENRMSLIDLYIGGVIGKLREIDLLKLNMERYRDHLGDLLSFLNENRPVQSDVRLIIRRYLDNLENLYNLALDYSRNARTLDNCILILRSLVENTYRLVDNIEGILWPYCNGMREEILRRMSEYYDLLGLLENALAENIRRLLADLDSLLKQADEARARTDLIGFIIAINGCLDILEQIENMVGDAWRSAYLNLLEKTKKLYSVLENVSDILKKENYALETVSAIKEALAEADKYIENAGGFAGAGEYRMAFLTIKQAYDTLYTTLARTIQNIDELCNKWIVYADNMITKFELIINLIKETGGQVGLELEMLLRSFRESLLPPPRDNITERVAWWAEMIKRFLNVKERVLSAAMEHILKIGRDLDRIESWMKNHATKITGYVKALEKGLPHSVEKKDFDLAENIAKPLLIIPYDEIALNKDRKNEAAVKSIVEQALEIIRKMRALDNTDPDNIILWFRYYENVASEDWGQAIAVASENIMIHYKTYAAHLRNMETKANAALLRYAGTKELGRLKVWMSIGKVCEGENDLYGALVYYTAVAGTIHDEAILAKIPYEEEGKPRNLIMIVAVAAVVLFLAAFFARRRLRKEKEENLFEAFLFIPLVVYNSLGAK